MSNSPKVDELQLQQKSCVNETFNFSGWTFTYTKSHILPSKCTVPCSRQKLCTYCFYTKEIELPHLPEMVFPDNCLKLIHNDSGCEINFNALDALKCVKMCEDEQIKIACSEDWRRSRQDTGLLDKTISKFDWTFSSDYSGTFKNWNNIEEDTCHCIDMEKLKVKEEILFFKCLNLYEDELHDNGVSHCTVRIRVMPSGFFILVRHFLRVDGVILRVNDTRIYHDFSTDFVLKEFSERQEKVNVLKLPIHIMNEPDEVTPLIPITKTNKQRIFFFVDNQTTSESIKDKSENNNTK